MLYLGVDIGTSFIKSALLDLDRMEIRDIRKMKAPDILPNLNSKAKEYDIEEIYADIIEIIGSYEGYTERLDGILFSTQMHGFVLADKDGKSVTNYISWQDERASEKVYGGPGDYRDSIYTIVDEEDITRMGMRLNSGYAVCSLYYLCKNNMLPKDKKLLFCTLGDYIISRLTGEKPCCHMTNAASSGMTDLKINDWNRRMIDALGFGNIAFPEIIKEDKPCGYFTINNRRIPVYPAVGDHQAAVLGAGIKPCRDLSINIGTGSQIGIVDRQLSFGDFQTRPYFSGCFIRAVPNIPAGRALNVLMNFIFGIGRDIFEVDSVDSSKIWKVIDKKVSERSSTDLKVNISFFESSLKENRGKIQDISEANLTIGDLFYGAYMNIADNYYMKYNKIIMKEDHIEKIVLSGGVARKNAILRQLIASKFELDTQLCKHSEDTMAGLLQLALICSKQCKDIFEAGAYLDKISVTEERGIAVQMM